MKKITKIAGIVVGIVGFLNPLTNTWLNLVNLHVLPDVHFGKVDGTLLILLSISTVFALLFSVGAFFLGGLYGIHSFASAIISSLIRLKDPTFKIPPFSPLRMIWYGFLEIWYTLTGKVFHRKTDNRYLSTRDEFEEFIKTPV